MSGLFSPKRKGGGEGTRRIASAIGETMQNRIARTYGKCGLLLCLLRVVREMSKETVVPTLTQLAVVARFCGNQLDLEAGFLKGVDPIRVFLVPHRSARSCWKYSITLDFDLHDRAKLGIGLDQHAHAVLAVAQFLCIQRNHVRLTKRSEIACPREMSCLPVQNIDRQPNSVKLPPAA